MLKKAFIGPTLYTWLSSISGVSLATLSPTGSSLFASFLWRCCESREGSTGKVTKEDFANASVHVTQTFKLLMCTHPESFPRLLQQKNTQIVQLPFCFISEFVLILFVCSFWKSYDNYVFSSLVAFVSDQITTLYYCQMYTYCLLLHNKITEYRIWKNLNGIKVCVCMCKMNGDFLAISQGTTITLHVSMWFFWFSLII